MDAPPPPLPNADESHLNLLAIFHYVVGAIGFVFACFPLIHVVIGILLIANPTAMSGPQQTPPPALFGFLFAGIGIGLVLLGWATAACTAISGRMIARRRHRMFSFVVAAILCMFVPFGTVLGVFTIIVLSKDSVKRLYGEAA